MVSWTFNGYSDGNEIYIELELDGNSVLFSRYNTFYTFMQLCGQALIKVNSVGSILKLKGSRPRTLYTSYLYPEAVTASLCLVR